MNKKRNYITELVSGSLILGTFDRFAMWVYTCLAAGLFGRIFTSYNPNLIQAGMLTSENRKKIGIIESIVSSDFIKIKVCRKFRRFISSGFESSLLINSILRLTAYLRGCRLKFYGFLSLSLGMYSGIVYLFETYILSRPTTIISLGISIGLVILSIPLVFSKHTLSSAIIGGKLSSFIFITVMGFRPDTIRHEKKPYGRTNVAFIIGLFFGLASFFVPTMYIILGIVGAAALYVILINPEAGILFVFVSLPFLPTMVLVGIIGYITVCYILKLIRGKRIFRLEPLDVAVLIFMTMVALGGVFSVSPSTSIKSVLVFICFMLGYFLTINLIRSKEWLVRCSIAAGIAAVIESLIGIAQYLLGDVETKWLDTQMFSDISGRVTSTLENPNVLAEYILLTLPIAAALLFSAKGFRQKFFAFLSCGIMAACLLLTWSRGAWIGMLVGAVLFIMIYHRRSIYLFIAGAASVPFLPFVLPDSIISRITSIGDMGDSSTSYRVYIWRASVKMIGDYFTGGIGVGEGAFRALYPRYSFAGIEAAPHSHNLYLQIWLEIGIFGLLIFAAFIFLFLQNNFTHCRELSNRDNKAGGDRVMACACMCGIVAVLVQGMTDYIWYNYRIFLMFWLIAGLSSSFIRVGRNEIQIIPADYKATTDSIDTEIK